MIKPTESMFSALCHLLAELRLLAPPGAMLGNLEVAQTQEFCAQPIQAAVINRVYY